MALRCFHYLATITDKELAVKIQELNEACSVDTTKLKKDKSLELLTEILYRSSQPQLMSQNPYILISCAIKCLIRYSDIPSQFSVKVSERKRKTRYELTKDNYDKLVKTFQTTKAEEITDIVIDVIHTDRFWPLSKDCVELISSLIEFKYNVSHICHEIFNKIEFSKDFNEQEIKLIVIVLYELLDNYKWPENEETAIFIVRLLNLFYKSSHVSYESEEDAIFASLRGSLELCVRHVIQNVSERHLLIIIQTMGSWAIVENVDEHDVLAYGSTLEFAAYVHPGDSLANTLTSDILSLLMQMIGSTVRYVSLLGNRVFQDLIDRGDNHMLFNTPKIFFEGMCLSLNISDYHKEDKLFIKLHREIIHDSLTKSIINHRNYRINLETTYCTMCLLAIEVPCGFTSAALCCLMMNLQDIVMHQQDQIGKIPSYHIHAMIVSVLSFICWTHEAKDFHAYVNKIVMDRAQWAPHLNPPLQSNYNFAVHHVLWDKPELFFVDWEVRYGLWKRFRLEADDKARRIYYEE